MPTVKRQLTPVPFTRVRLNDRFWAPRQEINRRSTLPHIYQRLEETGRISAFDLNFTRPLPAPIVLIFGDSDVAKWLEAACYSLALYPEAQLSAQVEQVAEKIIRAQAPDGYLNTHFLLAQPEMRWKNLRDWHEMYCAGHLIEAALAHHQATGETRLLEALRRYADHIGETFGAEPGKKRGYCGHPEIELALVRLYHATQERRYLEMAKFFVEERGAQPHYYDLEARLRGEDPASYWAKSYEYCQAHLPIRQQDKVVGHAVRAMYLLCAAADLAHEYADETLLATCERLWHNLVTRRLYLTGGIGPSSRNEGFTLDYDLPDETAYAETCAAIGLLLWNHRLLQFNGDRKYADVLERSLYNGILSGVSLDGVRFFYENPLASAGDHHRSDWFNCPCCPPNLARLIASVGNYFYSTSPGAVWVHLFASGEAELAVEGSAVRLVQRSDYPWSGEVTLEVHPSQPAVFDLRLRLPGWCPGYRLSLNGAPLQVDADHHIDRAVLHPAFVPHLHHQRVQEHDRIERLQRTVLPGLDLFQHRIGHLRYQRRAHFHAVDLPQVPLDLPRGHPPRVHRQDLVVETAETRLVLADDLRLEARVAGPAAPRSPLHRSHPSASSSSCRCANSRCHAPPGHASCSPGGWSVRLAARAPPALSSVVSGCLVPRSGLQGSCNRSAACRPVLCRLPCVCSSQSRRNQRLHKTQNT